MIMRRLLSAIALMTLAAASAGALDHPNLARGLAPDRMLSTGDLDSVNLFNGNLTLAVPLGQTYPVSEWLSYGFTLHYNSNVWDFEMVGEGDELRASAHLGEFNTGAGWNLSFGRLEQRFRSGDPGPGYWVFLSPDGSEHVFYDRQYADLSPDGAYYTRDGSHLRLQVDTPVPGAFLLEMPSGARLRIENVDPDGIDRRVVQMSDRYGGWVSIEYETTCVPVAGGGQECTETWTVTDVHGRVHSAVFRYGSPYGDIGEALADLGVKYLRRLDLAAAHGERAVYIFGYGDGPDPEDLARPCRDLDPETGAYESAWLLRQIDLPDGSDQLCTSGDCSYFRMDYNDPARQCVPPAYPDNLPGTLWRLRLPTGGVYEWGYTTWKLPSGAEFCGLPDPHQQYYDIVSETTGVHTKTVYWDTGSSATWTYTPDPYVPEPPNEVLYIVTRVTTPDDDDTLHYFRTKVEQCQDDWSGWDYGLPYKGVNPSGDLLYLSEQVFDGDANAGVKLREVWLRYERDVLPAIGDHPSQADWYDSNRRAAETRTLYYDDLDGSSYPYYKTEKLSSYDGFGHYRKVEFLGNLPNGGNDRWEFAGFNPHPSGVFRSYTVSLSTNQRNGSYLSWLPTQPWILGTTTYTSATEAGATARRDQCYDTSTGALTRERVRRSTSGTAGIHDVVAEYIRNPPNGQVTDVIRYGADAQTVGTAASACQVTVPYPPASWTRNDSYEAGVLARSFPIDPSTSQWMGFYSLDRTIDPSTGLTWKERDASGFETVYHYDHLGRVDFVTPANGTRSDLDYAHAEGNPGPDMGLGPFGRAGVAVSALDPSSGAALARSGFSYDGLGRLATEKHILADGQWNTRTTEYNGLGLVARQSEWEVDPTGDPPETTVWTSTSYDRLGRPVSVTPPDGSQHQVVLSYVGDRKVVRNVWIGTTAGTPVVETQVPTVTVFDRLGRLRKVKERSGAGGAEVETVYSYDVGNRLKQAQTAVAGLATQTRQYLYDAAGFLLQETVPERDGSVTYSQYDTAGNAGHVQENGSARSRGLDYHHDAAGRLTTVKYANDSAILKELRYWGTDGGGTWGRGRLRSERRVRPLGSESRTAGGYQWTKEYAYSGIGGRVSGATSTLASEDGQARAVFTESYTWTQLGDLATVGYPQAGTAPPAATVTYTYSNGWLTGVTSASGALASGLTYHPNGMYDAIPHSNGVTDRQSLASQMARPSRLWTTGATLPGGASGNWDSGAFSYDGAGNVTGIGQNVFLYDQVSRLKSSDQRFSDGVRRQASTTYDPFGNLTAESGTWTWVGGGQQGFSSTWPVDSARNRLSGSGVSYDYHGNLELSNGVYYRWDENVDQLAAVDVPGSRHFEWAYDARGERVGGRLAGEGGWFPHVYMRDLDGNLLREYQSDGEGGWILIRDYYYLGSRVLATRTPSEGTRHLHLDHLGTPRIITNALHQRVSSHEYQPFGEEYNPISQDGVSKKYTGHERDYYNTPGTSYDHDYMHARTYTPWGRRFVSVDPVGGDPRAPQSLNRYAYVLGNPIKYVDPWGLMECQTDGSGNVSCRDEIEVTADDPGEGLYSWVRSNQWYFDSQTVIQRGREAYGEIQWTDGALSAANEASIYQQLFLDEALSGNNEVLTWELLGPQEAGTLLGLESRGSPLDWLLFAGAAGLVRAAGAAAAYDAQQQAVIELAREAARTGVTRREAAALLRWAREYHLKPVLSHTKPPWHWVKGPHIRIGSVNHIEVIP
jgi:RHS repeat-associated protein